MIARTFCLQNVLGRLAQLVEQSVYTGKVAGSSPASPTNEQSECCETRGLAVQNAWHQTDLKPFFRFFGVQKMNKKSKTGTEHVMFKSRIAHKIKNLVKKFQRTIENFVCENCRTPVKGDGYTNHCPKCLWSRHVDVNPGDRAERCRGMMKPVETAPKSGEFYIVHQCLSCNSKRKNKVSKNDDWNEVVKISKSKHE